MIELFGWLIWPLMGFGVAVLIFGRECANLFCKMPILRFSRRPQLCGRCKRCLDRETQRRIIPDQLR